MDSRSCQDRQPSDPPSSSSSNCSSGKSEGERERIRSRMKMVIGQLEGILQELKEVAKELREVGEDVGWYAAWGYEGMGWLRLRLSQPRPHQHHLQKVGGNKPDLEKLLLTLMLGATLPVPTGAGRELGAQS